MRGTHETGARPFGRRDQEAGSGRRSADALFRHDAACREQEPAEENVPGCIALAESGDRQLDWGGESTPTMARHPAMTNKAILGARKFMEFLSNFVGLRPGPKPQRFCPADLRGHLY